MNDHSYISTVNTIIIFLIAAAAAIAYLIIIRISLFDSLDINLLLELYNQCWNWNLLLNNPSHRTTYGGVERVEIAGFFISLNWIIEICVCLSLSLFSILRSLSLSLTQRMMLMMVEKEEANDKRWEKISLWEWNAITMKFNFFTYESGVHISSKESKWVREKH